MYDELKRLLEAKAAAHWEYIDGLEIEQLLALIAEVERLGRESQNLSNQLSGCDRERLRLQAENSRSTEREILQLAEIESLRKDAEIGRLALQFFDRMDDPAECDPLEKSVGEFLSAVSTTMSMDAGK